MSETMVDKVVETVDYASWYRQLRRLAAQRELDFLIATREGAHRDAFDKGLSPAEELAVLEDLAEWRGCGCGGG